MRSKKKWIEHLREDLEVGLVHRQQLRTIARRHHVQQRWVISMFNRRTFDNLENTIRLLDEAKIEWRTRPGTMGTVILFLRTGDALITREGHIIGRRLQTNEEMFLVWR